MTLPPIDPLRFSLDRTAPALTTTVRPGRTTPDEGIRNTVVWIADVHLAGITVHTSRVLAHIDTDPAHAQRHARENAAVEFALTLRDALGYDPDRWEDQ